MERHTLREHPYQGTWPPLAATISCSRRLKHNTSGASTGGVEVVAKGDDMSGSGASKVCFSAKYAYRYSHKVFSSQISRFQRGHSVEYTPAPHQVAYTSDVLRI